MMITSCNNYASKNAFSFLSLVLALIVANAHAQFYVDWPTNTCVNDSNNRPWNSLYGSLEDCCVKALWWVPDCTITPLSNLFTQEPTSNPTYTPTLYPALYSSELPTNYPTRQPTPRPKTPRPASVTPRPTRKAPTQNPRPKRTPRPTNRDLLVEIGPSADTYIRESRPLANYGSRGSLHARAKHGSRESLLKFDLSSMHGKCIEKATLSLYSLVGAQSGGVLTTLVPKKNLFARDIRWKENEATWLSTKSKTKGCIVLKRLGRVRKNSWVDIDVTAGIKKSENLTFRIASSGPKVVYASKERRNYAPKLTIVLC